ncbi:MAG: peptide chain release factor-like protein [Candidatus Omnitrophica bacterium]|nr:peptide chain release factor-like protein [Candidatus Omnitrophota bacterium]
MPDFGLGLDKEKRLFEKMKAFGIREEDIAETFLRSRGPGGQNVNKTSTCVYLRHIPTGIEVRCQRERSQSLNRYLARRILADKIENIILGKLSQQEQRIEKIRRQKRRRSRRGKLKMLELKHRQSEKKLLRSKVGVVED